MYQSRNQREGNPLKRMQEKQLVRALLKDAYGRIAIPRQWTKDRLAKDSQNESIDPEHPDAKCWCSIGSLNRSGYYMLPGPVPEYRQEPFVKAMNLLEMGARKALPEGSPYRYIAGINDNYSWSVVKRMWKHALNDSKHSFTKRRIKDDIVHVCPM